VKRSFAFIFSVMLSLAGCGSSSSGPTLSTGTVYDTNAPNILVSTLAGAAGVAGVLDNPSGAAARFGKPNGMAISPDGTKLYVADFGNHTIRQIDLANGAAVTTLAGTAGTADFVDGIGAAAKFNGPQDIATDGTNLYVTDSNNNAIRKVVIATGAVTTVAGSSKGAAGSADGTGSLASFSLPIGIALSGSTLWVSDFQNNSIRKILLPAGDVTTPRTNLALGGPAGIAVDSGNLYVAEYSTRKIDQVTIANGAVTTLAGSSDFYGSADGVGTSASFLDPNGITLLSGSLYVTDTFNHTVRKVVISTREVTTLAGSPGVSGSLNGAGSAARFSLPIGIVNDGTHLFVADSGNFTVRKIQ
jgi:sugar lactone lactonase YvrE